jgi:hypothetical protein
MRKPVSNTVIKLAVCLLAIKEFWLLLGIPSFSNAVISFLTVGAIPGTGRSLSPVQIYWLLGAVFVVILFVVFRKELISAFGLTRTGRGHTVRMPIPHPYDPITVVTPPIRKPSVVARIKKSKWAWRLQAVLYVFMMQIVAATKRTQALLVALGRKAAPYIRRFDRWLEKKLRQYEHTATLLSIGNEMNATFRKLTKDAKDFAKNTPPLSADRRQS